MNLYGFILNCVEFLAGVEAFPALLYLWLCVENQQKT